jgi:hypothetical protein
MYLRVAASADELEPDHRCTLALTCSLIANYYDTVQLARFTRSCQLTGLSTPLEQSAMARNNIEERVATLEQQMAAVLAAVGKGRNKDWRRTLGMFTGDETVKRIDEQAQKYREDDRKKARRSPRR